MANGDDSVTIKAPLGIIDNATDFLGHLDPDHYAATLGRLVRQPEQVASLGGPASPSPTPTMLPSRLPNNLSMANLGRDPTGTQPTLAPVAFGRVGSMDQAQQQPRTRMGTLKHALGVAGEIAGSALTPNLMQWIPGTTQNRAMREGMAAEQQERAAGLEKTRAETALDIAKTKAEGGDSADVLQRYSAALADPNTPAEELERLRKGASAYEEVTQKPTKTAQGDEPIGSDFEGMNQGNEARWQVFHPGSKLPPWGILTAQSTRNQADRLDKMLQQIGTDFGTVEQRKAADELRQQQFAATQAARQETEEDRRARLGMEKTRLEEERPLREQAAGFAKANEYDKLTKDYVKGYENLQAVQDAFADPKRVLGPADWGLLMGHLQQFRAGGMRINNVEVQGLQRATDLMDRARGLGQNLTAGAVLGPELRDSILKITKDVLERTRQDRVKALKRAGFKDDEIDDQLKNPIGATGSVGGRAAVGSDEHVREWLANRNKK